MWFTKTLKKLLRLEGTLKTWLYRQSYAKTEEISLYKNLYLLTKRKKRHSDARKSLKNGDDREIIERRGGDLNRVIKEGRKSKDKKLRRNAKKLQSTREATSPV